MSESVMNGVDSSDRLLGRLIKTIEENSKITSQQNLILVKYTKWLFWLTVGIGVVAILQLVIVVKGV